MATTQDGGVNQTNKKRYLQSLYDGGGSGQKSLANNQAQGSGFSLDNQAPVRTTSANVVKTTSALKPNPTATPTPQTSKFDNQRKYLQNLYNTGTEGQRKWAANEAQNTGHYLGYGTVKGPNNYSQLWTPEQIRDFSNDQAWGNFDNARNDYQQAIDLNRLRQGQLDTNEQIQDRVGQQIFDTYSPMFTAMDNEQRGIETNYQNTLFNLQNMVNEAKQDLSGMARTQRGSAKGLAAARGIGDSLILDQQIQDINRSEMDNLANIQKEYSNNVFVLDNEINTAMQNLNANRTNLTERQQREMQQTINDLVNERDRQHQLYDLEIKQSYEDIANARQNIMNDANAYYMDLFNTNRSNWESDRAFAEQQRQFDLTPRYAGSGGGYTPTFNPTKEEPAGLGNDNGETATQLYKDLMGKQNEQTMKYADFLLKPPENKNSSNGLPGSLNGLMRNVQRKLPNLDIFRNTDRFKSL